MAHARILTCSQILEQMSDHMGSARKMSLAQKMVLYDSKLEGGSLELEEKVFYKEPDLFRSELRSKDTEKLHVASGEEALVIIDGRIVSEYESGFDHYKDLLALKDRMNLQKRLKNMGMNTSATRLERFNGRIVYVIGDSPEPFGELRPQLYIDKETFLPVKWIIRGTVIRGEKTDPMAVLYFDWKKEKRIFIPGRMEFYRNDILVREVRVKGVDFKSPVGAEIFNLEALKAEYSRKKEIPGGDDKPAAGQDPNREAIEKLGRIIENDRLAF